MSNIETQIRRLLDEAAIRDVKARFADAAMRADYAGFRSVWAEDAHWSIGNPPKVSATGADNIVAMLEKLRDGKEFFVQFAAQGSIKIDGDEAITQCICHEAARGPGEVYYRNHCVAFDRLKRSADGWVFTSRSFQYIWLDTSRFDGVAFPVPERGIDQ